MKDIITVTESLHQKSPLDTLVRQSSRRAEHSPRLLQPSTSTGPRGLGSHDRDPASPLLHTSFRTSASTAMSTENSFRRGASTDRDIYWRNEDESIYSSRSDSPDYSSADDVPYVVDTVGDQSPTLPPSPTPSSPLTIDHDQQEWTSPRPDDTVQEDISRQSQDTMRDTWRSSGSADPFTFQRYESPRKQVPTVVVSSPMSPIPKSSYYESSTTQPVSHSSPVSRHPSSTHSALNFSRPIRPPAMHDGKSKREVWDRNQAINQMSPNAHPVQQQHSQGGYSPYDQNSDTQFQQLHQQYSSTTLSPFPQYPLDQGQTSFGNSILSHSASATAFELSSRPLASNHHSRGVNPQRSTATSSPPGHIRLPTSPPSPRPPSRISLYSTYSFYQLEDRSRASSPHSAQEAPNPKPGLDDATTVTVHSPSPPPFPFSESGISPDEYLSLGIKHHEANRLAESAVCFERAATIDGGCGVGMLMWGLSLRHAWGIAKDEKAAFWWLRRAAEAAVGDLEEAREGVHQNAVKSELVLAIYEVGQCFYHGWGVAQDKKMAVSYFQVAARLGDSDAQQELGYCLANGKGCKKDLKEAAKWYRAAAAQGASTIGLTWIYKPKYA